MDQIKESALTTKTTTPINSLRSLLESSLFKQAEEQAIEFIRANPLHAQAWVYLGEALLHQGYAGQARRALDRGWLLDPQAIWTGAVEKALKNRKDGPVRQAVDKLLTLPPVTVSAAIIARNEARCIVRCVNSLVDAVDEIIVLVDSDSSDGTIELIEHLPKVKLIRNVDLNNDFAGKRNKGLPHITNDWVLWVDADEWLFVEDVAAVREAAALFHSTELPTILNVCQVNYMSGRESRDYSMPRMFPLNRGLHYYGRVHEQVVVEGKNMYEGGAFRQSVRIRLHHDGYEPHIIQQKDKLSRNLNLLEQMVAEEPDNPGWLLYYGRETLGTGDIDKAQHIFLEAERAAEKTPQFGRLADILMYLHRIYMSKQDFDQAEKVCLRTLEVEPNYPDAMYHLAQVQMRKAVLLLQNAEKNLNQSKEAFQTYRGTVTADRNILSWKADLALADLTRLSGKQGEAIKRYEQIVQEHPELEKVKAKLERLKTQL